MEEDAEQIAEDHTAKGGGYQKRKTQTDECGDGKIHLPSKNEHEKTEKEIDDNQNPPDLLEVFHQGAGPFRHELPLSASQVSFVIRAQEPAIRNSKAERRNPPHASIALRMALPNGFLRIPTSVMIPVMRLWGVTSKAGLRAETPAGATLRPRKWVTSRGSRCSMGMA